ncbi:MAG: ABC transporter permease, partial [Oscillospiraceae bacterium]
MGKFILKRIGQLILSLFIASILVFIFVRLSDTDPVAVILGGKQTSQETIQAIKEKFNLDKPLFQQYLLWIDGLFHGDLGLSFKYQTSINELIGPRILTTLGLVSASSVIALVIAIPLGIFCAVKKHTLWDRAGSIFSLILAGCPSFFVSILLILLISAVAPTYPFTGTYANFAEYCQRLFVPSLALACTMIALASRV